MRLSKTAASMVAEYAITNIQERRSILGMRVSVLRNFLIKPNAEKAVNAENMYAAYRNILPFLKGTLADAPRHLYRDRQMFKNLLWLLRYKYPNEKFIIWAHNAHIAKSQCLGKEDPMAAAAFDSGGSIFGSLSTSRVYNSCSPPKAF